MDFLNNVLSKFGTFISNIDVAVTVRISEFYSKGYFNQTHVPGLASKIPVLTRIVLYLFVILLLLIPLKIFLPENKIRTAATFVVFISMNICLFGIFFGFFQLLFS